MATGEAQQLPGYREIYKTPEQERSLLSRTKRYAAWLTEPMERKSQLNKDILDNTEQPIDIDELGRTKILEYGKGFPGHPPPEYSIGEEPPTAPMSQEQLSLLLIRTVPTEMIPFVKEHFIIDYDIPDPSGEDGPPAQPTPGPTVRILPNDKIHVTFYRDNFFTEDIPPHLKNNPDREVKLKARHLAGFVDPSKVTVLFGQIISHMIPPPPNWDKIVDKKFHVTKELTDKKRPKEPAEGSRKEQNAAKKEARLRRQWADFVGLALVAPELAKQQYPDAYSSFLASMDGFSNVQNDKETIKLLRAQAGLGGVLQLAGTKMDLDVRTEDQKLKDKGISPQIAAYEQFIARINNSWAMRILGKKIVYEPPQDLVRSLSLAEDDGDIKKIMETSPEETMRDMDFGEILSTSDNKDLKARNKARRYLLAASQNGEFAEWRVYAWLFKFSETFRKSQGRNISETDYKDLRMVYDQSDKLGNRIGTNVMPYDAIALTPQNYPGAENLGRKIYFYVRKDRAKYIKEVEKKVRSKSVKAVLTASQDSFKQFKTQGGRNLGFDEVYGPSAEGLSLSNGSLDQFLGEPLAKEYAQWLQQAGVSKIPPDAQAIAAVWFDYYNSVDRNWKDHYLNAANETTRKVITEYADQLNRPPEEEARERFAVPAEAIAESGNPEHIADEIEKTAVLRKRLEGTVGVAADRNAGLSTDIKDYLLMLIKDKYHSDAGVLMRLVGDEINKRFAGNNDEAANERRNLMRFMMSPEVQRSLKLLTQTNTREKKLQPSYTGAIERATTDLTQPDIINKIIDPKVKEVDLEIYEKLGIKFSESERKEIESAGIIVPETPAPNADGTLPPPDVNAVVPPPDVNLQETERSRLLRLKIQESTNETRQRVVVHEMVRALTGDASLDKYLTTPTKTTYSARYQEWLKRSGRIFAIPAFTPATQRLAAAVKIMDTPESIRLGIEEKSQTVDALSKSINYADYRLNAPKKKAAKPAIDSAIEEENES